MAETYRLVTIELNLDLPTIKKQQGRGTYPLECESTHIISELLVLALTFRSK